MPGHQRHGAGRPLAQRLPDPKRRQPWPQSEHRSTPARIPQEYAVKIQNDVDIRRRLQPTRHRKKGKAPELHRRQKTHNFSQVFQ